MLSVSIQNHLWYQMKRLSVSFPLSPSGSRLISFSTSCCEHVWSGRIPVGFLNKSPHHLIQTIQHHSLPAHSEDRVLSQMDDWRGTRNHHGITSRRERLRTLDHRLNTKNRQAVHEHHSKTHQSIHWELICWWRMWIVCSNWKHTNRNIYNDFPCVLNQNRKLSVISIGSVLSGSIISSAIRNIVENKAVWAVTTKKKTQKTVRLKES